MYQCVAFHNIDYKPVNSHSIAGGNIGEKYTSKMYISVHVIYVQFQYPPKIHFLTFNGPCFKFLHLVFVVSGTVGQSTAATRPAATMVFGSTCYLSQLLWGLLLFHSGCCCGGESDNFAEEESVFERHRRAFYK